MENNILWDFSPLDDEVLPTQQPSQGAKKRKEPGATSLLYNNDETKDELGETVLGVLSARNFESPGIY